MHRASSPLNDARERPLAFLRFGVFELDVRSGELRRQGSLVRLQPQPFKVLVLLASRPGDVVTREEIQAEVWPAGTFVDFEQSLNFCIRQIRAALGDNALAPRYVETLPRRGYRWVGGPVERVNAPVERREWPRAVGPEGVPGVEGESPSPETLDTEAESPAPGEAAEQALGLVAGATPAVASRRRWPAVLLGLTAAGAVAVAAWLALRPPTPARPPSFQRLTFRRGLVSSARFAPDGQVLFAAAWDGQSPRVYVNRTDPRDSRALDISSRMVVGVSPSGEVAFLSDRVLSRAPIAGGPAKGVLTDVIAADWTADGADFAVVRRVGDGRFRLEFPIGHVLADAPRSSRVRISPDASHLAAAVHVQPDDDRGGVVIWDRSGRIVARSDGWGSLDGIAWPPGGREVWFTATRVGADNAVQALGLDGRVRPVLSGMGRLVLHDIAPDGRLLLESATIRSEILFRREGESEDKDLSWFDFSAAVGLSADGNSVFFFESGQGGGPGYTTFVRRTDGSPPVRVGGGRALSLSPDAQWTLAVGLSDPDHLDLLPTGPGEARSLRLPGAAVVERAGFIGDGRRVFATATDVAGARSTWVVNLDGSSPRKLALADGRFVFEDPFSVDGTRVAQSCPKSIGPGPCIYPVDGGTPVPVRGAKPEWYPVGWDERGRLYLRDGSMRVPEVLWRLDPATGHATSIAELSPRDRAGVIGIGRVVVSNRGDAWAYSVFRRLSDLHVVAGVR